MNDVKPKRRLWPWMLLSLLVLPVGIAQLFVCVPAWVQFGVRVGKCPDGEMRPVLWANASGLRRGTQGTVNVQAFAHYTTGPADRSLRTSIGRLDEPALSLFGPSGEPAKLSIETKRTRRVGPSVQLFVTLDRELADGDYTLKVASETSLGKVTGELKLPLYAPAIVHVLTDRPLYEPGNVVRFRAVALRARDLTPLDGRPGRFIVKDRTGEIVLEERALAGPFGVVESSFPLDDEAESGTWIVEWASGDAIGSASFEVEPFTLPRFRIEAEAGRSFYTAGDVPKLLGRVTYSSGAPVAGASLELDWRSHSPWPLPTEWLDGLLPRVATADPLGHFELVLPAVPADVRGLVPVSVSITAHDQTGDQVVGAGSVLFAEDELQVSAVSELESGIVEGFNNRVYLRATTPAGAVISGVELLVKRAWEPSDKGIRGVTDEDGVAAFQLDPGPPVNVVVPPMPVRLPRATPPVERGEATDLLAQDEARLEDQAQLDLLVPELHPCCRFVAEGTQEAQVALRVEPSGKVTFVGHAELPATRCLADVLRSKRLPAGPERLLRVAYTVSAPDTPRIDVESVEGDPSEPPFRGELERQLLDARACLPESATEGAWPRLLTWSVLPDLSRVSLTWTDDPRQIEFSNVSPQVLGCVEARVRDVELTEPIKEAGLGVVRLMAHASPRSQAHKPQPTTMIGYELLVSATSVPATQSEKSEKAEQLGSTKIFVPPGSIPPVRLRLSSVLAKGGDKLELELIRGPGFPGALPEKLWMGSIAGQSVEAKLDPETRKATFELPSSAKGWWRVEYLGARALVYVRSDDELSVSLAPDKDRYAPGDVAQVSIQTTAGGVGTSAAVGLFGVDSSLEQLARLAGVDEWDRVRPTVTTAQKAFDVLDGAALALGRVRGANAAAATVLRVTALPSLADQDIWVSAQTQGEFDPIEPLTDHFYQVLSELHAVVREWERSAPEKDQMRPPKMAGMWKEALTRARKRGESVHDAFGRDLTLSMLPPDLLSLTDPRAVVVKGTRLPEDVEDWQAWVRKNRP
ncbi:MAG: hypothetical protein HY791_40355 [Deltaproteobacteria bacterium]|nr:hypothetical protein [Deltaproteobacteria bacterium]